MLPIIVAESVVFYSAGSAMLFVPQQFDEPTDEQCGLWTRARLEQMNRSFVAAMEQAFANGGESHAAASATVLLNGSRRLAEEKAIEAAWNWLTRERGNVAASQIIAYVREQVPGIGVERIRSEFDRRFKQRGMEWV